MKTVELCTDREWLEVFSAIDFEGIEFIDDAASEFINTLDDKLIDAGFEVVFARGQRRTCHGWNGANTFEKLLGPVGSFDDLTNDECEMIQECIDFAEESMRDSFCDNCNN